MKTALLLIVSAVACSGQTTQLPEYENLYRNAEFRFRIIFPSGWQIRKGKDPTVLAKAVGPSGTSVGVGAVNMPFTGLTDTMTVNDIPEAEFIAHVLRELKAQAPDATIVKTTREFIDNKPALAIRSKMTVRALDLTAQVTQLSYFVIHRKRTLGIYAGGRADLFDSNLPLIRASIGSFKFEDHLYESSNSRR